MPLLKVNARIDAPLLDGGGDLDAALADALKALPPGAPVVVLIHGYKFSPARDETSPHAHILALDPVRDCWKARSWPRALGFGTSQTEEGLCIAFGWEARGSIWGAWRRAALAGRALGRLLDRIAAAGAAPVGIVAHSLGGRVALAALHHLPAGAVGRVVLLAGAEFRANARAAVATPAGRAAEFVNVTSRENDLYDRLLEWFIAAPKPGARALGAGLGEVRANWLDLSLDCSRARSGLAALGYPIPAPDRRICHWSSYLRPGVFALYSALLRQPGALPLGFLRDQTRPAPRPACTAAPQALADLTGPAPRALR